VVYYMFSFLWLFLIFQSLYHILVTVFWYGLHLIDQSNFALIRDWIWILFVWIVFLFNFKYLKSYFRVYWRIWWSFILLLMFSCFISYFFLGKSLNELLIGIKYWLWWIVILLSATFLGFCYRKRDVREKETVQKWKLFLKWWLLIVVILWWIWQLLKLIIPDFFFSLWYWKLDDFHYWENPPIYYLTWYEGTLRWQWIFAGPNNYWYFLILFMPLILLLFPLWNIKSIRSWSKEDWFNFWCICLWVLSILATVSRAAIIWLIVIFLLMNIKFLKQHKKFSLTLFLFFVFWIGLLSLWKRDSTKQHIEAKWNWVKEVINQPLWYWLWSSWPAVHHSWMFLPENYYLQLMLDLWTVWFIFWCWVFLLWLFEEKKLCLKILSLDKWNDDGYQIFIALQRWLIVLFIMGLFLHVFEDSMVNYLFFIPYWFVLGYLSTLMNKR